MTDHLREPVRFGIFDWLDESGRSQRDSYADRLRMLELADQRGFYAYHLAEHHQTELSTVPSPNLFLSAVAQRTRQLRLGALSYILPLYPPMRLLEEICMLDQLSGGRVELGLSRGSTGEHVENDPEKARAMFNEALHILLQGLSTGEIDFHGNFYTFEKQFTRLRPVQKPYPPLWYPTSNAESIAWVAANGINTAFSVHLSPDFDRIAHFARQYWDEYTRHASDEGKLNGKAVPKVGLSVHIHVAETDAKAREQAKPAFELFQHNYLYRMIRRGQPERYEGRKHFDEELAENRIVVGAPATVRERLADWLERSGANYIIGCFAFGSLTGDQMLSSVDLFAREVMPALANTREVSAA